MKSLYVAAAPILSLLMSCSGNSQQLTEVGKLDLKEVSGLEYSIRSGELWALEDSGNENKLYKISADGKTETSVTISNAKNNDWEELTTDKEGNLYIGDFGNNSNDRKNLSIYKIEAKNPGLVTYTVSFYYPEQTAFPPKKSAFIYDCEAFFEHKGNFYLFTKNRSSNFNGSLNIYKVPNVPGNHAAKLMGSLTTCGAYRKCAVTGADISPDGTKAVLLTGDKVFLITNFGEDDFAGGTMQQFDLGEDSQKEGICFTDDATLLIADEKDKKSGGKLYEVKLSDLKAKH
jgi:hypothetical protein